MKYFGTDGFRGEVNKDLTVEHALKIGQYIGWYFKQQNTEARCVIGKDTRCSSYMLEYALAAGITSSGTDVYLMHVTTTPSVSYTTRVQEFDCGIMITASHNPYTDNGIKLIDSKGNKMSEDILELVEKFIDGEITIPISSKTGKCYDHISGRNAYIGYLAAIPEHSFRGYKVGLDCANGASYAIAKNVFSMLGAEVFSIGDRPDGENINREAGSTHIGAMQKFVVEKGLDIGFAFDGDADRCMAVNERGEVMDGDAIMYIIGRSIKHRGRLTGNTVVVTTMTNLGFLNAMKAEDINVAITDVGDKYVAAEMFAHDYQIGGEQSGHIIISKFASTGDGILTALVLMDILVTSKTLASGLTTGLEILPQKLKNIRTEKKNEIAANKELNDFVAKRNEEIGSAGRILLRKSGTEPLIRIMAEGRTIEDCERYIAETEEVMNRILETL